MKIQGWSYLVLFAFLGCSSSIADESKPSADELIALVDDISSALSTIQDKESIKKVSPELRKWGGSIFNSKQKRDQEYLLELFMENDALRQAIEKHHKQFQRIASIDENLPDLIFEEMTGAKPFHSGRELERIASILEKIESDADFEENRASLEEVGRPFYEWFEANLDAIGDWTEGQPKFRAAMLRVKRESLRIEKLDAELGAKVVAALMTEEVSKRLRETEKEAENKLAIARANLEIAKIRTAIFNYYTEYRRYPFSSNSSIDVFRSGDQAFLDLLQANDRKTNPRVIRFLDESVDMTDSWGTPYRIIVDSNYDNQIDLPEEYEQESVDAGVGVESAGPDKKFETIEDNLASWLD